MYMTRCISVNYYDSRQQNSLLTSERTPRASHTPGRYDCVPAKCSASLSWAKPLILLATNQQKVTTQEKISLTILSSPIFIEPFLHVRRVGDIDETVAVLAA